MFNEARLDDSKNCAFAVSLRIRKCP
ncbi:hypothetical protein [Klebsiella quasipneumoniae]